MKIENIYTFEQFGAFLEEVHGSNAIAYESLLNRFAELSEMVDHSSQANEVLQKLQHLKPGDVFDKRIEELAGSFRTLS